MSETISARLRIPKADFAEREHQRLHQAMGETFDHPEAARFLSHAYATMRQGRPHIHPRHALEASRGAWHAMEHGYLLPEHVGPSMDAFAARKHAEDPTAATSYGAPQAEPEEPQP